MSLSAALADEVGFQWKLGRLTRLDTGHADDETHERRQEVVLKLVRQLFIGYSDSVCEGNWTDRVHDVLAMQPSLMTTYDPMRRHNRYTMFDSVLLVGMTKT